jgi:hypothetical protein
MRSSRDPLVQISLLSLRCLNRRHSRMPLKEQRELPLKLSRMYQKVPIAEGCVQLASKSLARAVEVSQVAANPGSLASTSSTFFNITM